MFPLALIPTVVSLASTAFGMNAEANARQQQQQQQQQWNSENETLYNKDYYSDYTKRADAANVIKQMRDEMKKQTSVDNQTAVVTGETPEAQIAKKDSRNKSMSNLFGNLAAQGQQYKDRAENRYLARKSQLEGMAYDTTAQQAESGNNLLYNGIKGMGSTNWADVLGVKK
jgi:hypothetical protein